ncbi:hypothetical protein BDV29DRAFT_184886 [Aspergillus leporis]|uniref:P-loop containing nucleoside triphosphate hydrolase protein n=1 Tax=Aspergillus leporis TaxID=41062 RepID=A0A5N5WMJ4_9EURO|nr:hypothetical protein BDV29DRAFT_184886 [Aspergillus leporis]
MFSHGQRQLLYKARTMFKEGNLDMLDECTSPVNKSTDNLIQNIIRSHHGNYTLIAITQRLETVLGLRSGLGNEKWRAC